MNIRSEDQIRAENAAAMGAQLGALYSALWQELAGLHFKWREYLELYGTKESRVALLNAAAPYFFRLVEDAFWENILLHLCRLTDPPSTSGRGNLTVSRITPLVAPAISPNIAALVSAAQAKTEFCRDWRNRHIAHADFDLALKEGAKPLKTASRADVEAALQALRDVLNAIEVFYLKQSTGFDLAAVTDGAEELLYVLDDGVKARKAREERLQTGRLLPEDSEGREV